MPTKLRLARPHSSRISDRPRGISVKTTPIFGGDLIFTPPSPSEYRFELKTQGPHPNRSRDEHPSDQKLSLQLF